MLAGKGEAMPPIRVYHSFRSPYSRLGLHILAREGLDAELAPFTGPPDGVEFNDPVANPLKLSYYMQDAPRMTLRMGLPISPPQPFDVDLAPSYKAAVAAAIAGKGLAYALEVSDARWGKGKDISDMSVLEICAEKAGWEKSAVSSAQDDPSVAAEMKRHRNLIAEDGVFGVPFAIMGSKKYWGHDRFGLLVEDANKEA